MNYLDQIDCSRKFKILTVAKSFWLSPLAWRPCWINFPTSKEILLCLNSSVSRSNLAVFLVAMCCLLVPAPSEINKIFTLNLERCILFLLRKLEPALIFSGKNGRGFHLHFCSVATATPVLRAWFTALSVFKVEAFGAFLRKTVTVSQSLMFWNLKFYLIFCFESWYYFSKKCLYLNISLNIIFTKILLLLNALFFFCKILTYIIVFV